MVVLGKASAHFAPDKVAHIAVNLNVTGHDQAKIGERLADLPVGDQLLLALSSGSHQGWPEKG